MSDVRPNFRRNNKGRFREDSGITSIFFGSDAVLLEDELNEIQWNRIENNTEQLRAQYTSGILSDFEIVKVDDEISYIESKDGKPIKVVVDGYIAKIGGNRADHVLSADHRIIFDTTPEDGLNEHDNLHFLEFWFEVVDKTSEIRKFGGEDTELIPNPMVDSRVGFETSRRIQMKWKVNWHEHSLLENNSERNKGYKLHDENLYIKEGLAVVNTQQETIDTGVRYAIVFAKGSHIILGNPVEHEFARARIKNLDFIKDILKEEVKDGLKDDLQQDIQDEIKDNLKDELQQGIQDDILVNLKDDIKADIQDDIKDVVKQEIQEDLSGELRRELVTESEINSNTVWSGKKTMGEMVHVQDGVNNALYNGTFIPLVNKDPYEPKNGQVWLRNDLLENEVQDALRIMTPQGIKSILLATPAANTLKPEINPAANIVTNNLEGYWNFNSGLTNNSWTNLSPFTAGSYNGVITNGRTASNGFYLNNNSITIETPAQIRKGSFTIELILRPENLQNRVTLFNNISIDRTAIVTSFYKSDNTAVLTENPINISNLEYHIAIVFDNSNLKQHIYINGVLISSKTTAGVAYFNNPTFNIGGVDNTQNSYFKGYLKMLRMYSRPLTGLEINKNRIVYDNVGLEE